MALHLHALSFDANDAPALARFWAGVLRRDLVDDPDGGLALVPDDAGFPIRFVPSKQPKAGPNQMHFDLTSASRAGQEETVSRALLLGARHFDIGQTPDEGHVVLADPEGNEFCLLTPCQP